MYQTYIPKIMDETRFVPFDAIIGESLHYYQHDYSDDLLTNITVEEISEFDGVLLGNCKAIPIAELKDRYTNVYPLTLKEGGRLIVIDSTDANNLRKANKWLAFKETVTSDFLVERSHIHAVFTADVNVRVYKRRSNLDVPRFTVMTDNDALHMLLEKKFVRVEYYADPNKTMLLGVHYCAEGDEETVNNNALGIYGDVENLTVETTKLSQMDQIVKTLIEDVMLVTRNIGAIDVLNNEGTGYDTVEKVFYDYYIQRDGQWVDIGEEHGIDPIPDPEPPTVIGMIKRPFVIDSGESQISIEVTVPEIAKSNIVNDLKLMFELVDKGIHNLLSTVVYVNAVDETVDSLEAFFANPVGAEAKADLFGYLSKFTNDMIQVFAYTNNIPGTNIHESDEYNFEIIAEFFAAQIFKAVVLKQK